VLLAGETAYFKTNVPKAITQTSNYHEKLADLVTTFGQVMTRSANRSLSTLISVAGQIAQSTALILHFQDVRALLHTFHLLKFRERAGVVFLTE